jgi:hypothetical protein
MVFFFSYSVFLLWCFFCFVCFCVLLLVVRRYYYYLTDEGIDHLRGYLSLPAEIIPNTLKKQAQQARLRALFFGCFMRSFDRKRGGAF